MEKHQRHSHYGQEQGPDAIPLLFDINIILFSQLN